MIQSRGFWCGFLAPLLTYGGFWYVFSALILTYLWAVIFTILLDLGHRNITHTVRYTELRSDRFDGFWKD